MPRLIYFRQSDEVPPQLYLEEDSDSWWAGVQHSFVAIPIATILTTVSLSAALSFGYQQQTDDIFPPPPTIVEEDYWQVHTPQYLSPKFLYLPDPEEIPAGELRGALDEDYWLNLLTRADKYAGLVTFVDDEIVEQPVVFVPSEDYWSRLLQTQVLTKSIYLPESDEVLPEFILGQPDEDYWQVHTPRYLQPKFLYLPLSEETPSLSSALVFSPIGGLTLDLGGGLAKTLKLKGNLLTMNFIVETPIDPPPGGSGIVFKLSGGVVTIYVWSGSAWIAN